jgi:hypothetical protein
MVPPLVPLNRIAKQRTEICGQALISLSSKAHGIITTGRRCYPACYHCFCSKIGGFHGGDYEECCLLGFDIVWVL